MTTTPSREVVAVEGGASHCDVARDDSYAVKGGGGWPPHSNGYAMAQDNGYTIEGGGSQEGRVAMVQHGMTVTPSREGVGGRPMMRDGQPVVPGTGYALKAGSGH